ncbi:MAG: hypothetical protein CM1200mP10_11010 [Candidatus Neomarinimicrobiota bacterium]|nr:MAG: hypothetical protein CM1200mP10_11010 [Candidatus Neomarinimicrobiota bacterium]
MYDQTANLVQDLIRNGSATYSSNVGILLGQGWTATTSKTMNTPDPQAISVSDLTQQIKNVLEGSFPILWIFPGEISNFVHHGSGHMYFTLKDDKAEIRGFYV